MALTRRGLFGLLPALGGIAVTGKTEIPNDVVKPITLEHVCDGGKSRCSPEQIAEQERYWREELHVEWHWGCGTRFQWHWGTYGNCPNCGYAYYCTLEEMKSGFYKRV